MNRVVVRLTGDADLSTLPLITDALSQGAGLGTPHVVVDVAAAHFWDSSGLRALAGFTEELAAADRSCRIVGALADTRRLVGIAYLTDRLVLDGALPARPAPAPLPRPVPARRQVSGHPVSLRDAQTPVGAGRPSRRD